MMKISNTVNIPETEIELHFIRSQGAGGQNVNKVSSAVHLRFDIRASSLPEAYKEKLLALKDHRISDAGVIVIKAQRFRRQEQNREDAMARLHDLISTAMQSRKKRKATRPSRSSQRRRMDSKTKHGKQKSLRKKVDY